MHYPNPDFLIVADTKRERATRLARKIALGLVILCLAILTSACSIGQHSRNLHTNLDMPRQNVEIQDEQIIVSPFITGPIRCASLAYDHGLVGEGNAMLIGAAIGNAQFNAVLIGTAGAKSTISQILGES